VSARESTTNDRQPNAATRRSSPPGGVVAVLPAAAGRGIGAPTVIDDALKLTTYFGERDRTPDGLLADELLDVYGGHGIHASILLRGVEGFGRLHHMHTDQLLTLSEDLPVVSVAVDRRERIEAVLEPILKIKRRGLITLERARLLSGDIEPFEWPDELGEATKLTVYVGRHERVHKASAFEAVCDLLYRRGIAGATVLLGVDGTSRGRRARAEFFARNASVPSTVLAVGSGPQIAEVLPELSGLLHDPVLTLERVRICKRDGELIARPHELPAVDEHGLAMWQKLTIIASQAATHEGRSIHSEIIRRLRATDAAGATSLRGVWGFHGDHAPHGDRLLRIRRHVPVVTIVIDTSEKIAASFDIVDELTTEHGLVTSEMVPAMAAISERRTRGGLRLARHDF
jgi:PII-like signaling protein